MVIRRGILVGVLFVWIAMLAAACATAELASPPIEGGTLSGSEWELVSLNGGDLIEGRAITLRFGEAVIEGSGGCNTYRGSYSSSGDSLRLSDLAWTEMACIEPDGIMVQEQAYFEALSATDSYQIVQESGDRLELYDKAGAQRLAFIASPQTAIAGTETPTSNTPVLSPDCTLDMDESYPVGEPVSLRFALHNPTDRALYVLTWYTPLEGMAGDMLRITQDGQELPYQGMLAKRGDPTRQEYTVIEPGETASAQVDLSEGYDLQSPGSYQVQFTTGLQDVTDDGSRLPHVRDDHRPQSVPCNTVAFSIVPASEPPAATPTDAPPATTPAPEPPAGFRRYVNGASGVALWVPESWTIIEPGPHTPILQSYPQDKYVGGEPRQPGDTKCDLTVHPRGTSVEDLVQQLGSTPNVTVVSEQEIVLHSGGTGTRMEVESLGRSLSLFAEVNERAVVLTCFGELASFDEIAETLGASE